MNWITVRRVLESTRRKMELGGTPLKVQLYLIQRVTLSALGAKIPSQVVGPSCILYQYQGEMPLFPTSVCTFLWTVHLIGSELSFFFFFFFCLVKHLSTYSHSDHINVRTLWDFEILYFGMKWVGGQLSFGWSWHIILDDFHSLPGSSWMNQLLGKRGSPLHPYCPKMN